MGAEVKCKHRKSWLTMSGRFEWCYECGAFRMMEVINGKFIGPATTWARPVGAGGPNPYCDWQANNTAYNTRRAKHGS